MNKVTLTPEQANLVLQALSKFPFEQVAPLINEIGSQLKPTDSPK